MRNIYIIVFLVLATCYGCEWRLPSDAADEAAWGVVIDRYDQLEYRYLSTGDIAALQQMNTEYPTETRMLVEDLLHLGPANDPEMKKKLLYFFQDSTLKVLLRDVKEQYGDMSDVEEQLTSAFDRLKTLLPGFEVPRVYTQISSLDQSIVAGDGFLGISLDKYLGSDYPLYLKYGYTERQRSMMDRTAIVPDCIGFYLLGLFPFPENDTTHAARIRHIGKIQYVVNQVMDHRQFDNEQVREVEEQVAKDKSLSVEKLLQSSR